MKTPILAGALGALVLAAPAQALIVMYTDKASFDAAAALQITTEVTSNFEGFVSDGGILARAPLTIDNVDYITQFGELAAICGKSRCGNGDLESAIMTSNNGDPLDIRLGGIGFDVSAIGGVFGGIFGANNATISLFGGLGGANPLGSFNVGVVGDMAAGEPKTFFGFVATGGEIITLLRYDMVGLYEAVDDMQFGGVASAIPGSPPMLLSAVPIPAAAPLLAAAIGALALLRRRRRV